MLLVIPFGLIGDTIGTIPAIDYLARERKKKDDTLFVSVHYDGRPVLEMAESYQREEWRFADWKGDGIPHGEIKQINLPKVANSFGTRMYMTQAYFGGLNLPIPETPPRPKLLIRGADIVMDGHYGLAPFARSLGPGEKWDRFKWQRLVDSMPDKQFVLYGSHRDDPEFVTGPNVTPYFDRPLERVCHSMKYLTHGLISVSTGLSHLAYALGVKNYLLIRQGPFACNPSAIRMEPMKTPDSMTLEDVQELLKR
jgi:hypothetical protein